MPRQYVDLNNWLPGMVQTKHASIMAIGEAYIAQNLDLSENKLRPRWGWSKFHTADLPTGAANVTSLFVHDLEGSAATALAVAGTTLMKRIISSSPDFVTVGTFTGATAPVYCQFVQLKDTTYMAVSHTVSGSGETNLPVWKWTPGGGMAAVSGAPTVRSIGLYDGKLVAASSGYRLYWSKTAPNQETWPATNYIDFDPDDGDSIRQVVPFNDSLIILKKKKIYRLTGTLPEDAATSSTDVRIFSFDVAGSIASKGFAVSPSQVLYLSRDGIYTFNGLRTTNLLEGAAPYLRSYDIANSAWQACGAWMERDKHFLLTERAGSSTNTWSIWLNPLRVSKWQSLNIYSMTQYTPNGSRPRVLIGLPGAVGLLGDSSTDNGTNISFDWRTGSLPLSGSLTAPKVLRRGQLWGAGHTADLVHLDYLMDNWSREVDTTVDLAGTSVGSDSGEAFGPPKLLPPIGLAREWSLYIWGYAGTSGVRTEVDRILLEFEVKP